MFLSGKRPTEIEYGDLMRLVEDGVSESPVLEYKEQLPGGSDGEKKEFLADVSALANTSGGVIVFGIAEDRDSNHQPTGVPASIPGLSGINPDKETQRLEAILRDGLEPPLTRVATAVVEEDGKEPVILIGIPRSLLAPHMVVFKRDGKFWRRSTAGKYQMDVTDLRQAFLEAETWREEVERFRRERIEVVRSDEFRPQIDRVGSFFLHVLPLGRLREQIDLGPHHTLPDTGTASSRSHGVGLSPELGRLHHSANG